MRSIKVVFGAILTVMLIMAGSGYGQDKAKAVSEKWPTKPIRMIVPASPGGSSDRAARLMLPNLQKELGVSVMVENIDGAGSVLATKTHYNSQPADGTYFLMCTQPYLSAGILRGAEYKLDSFDQLPMFYFTPTSVWVKKNSDIKSMKDLIQRWGTLKHGIVQGAWQQFVGVHLDQVLGKKARQVPYKTGGDTRIGLLAGDIDFLMSDHDGTASALGADARCVAVFADKRLPDLPDVPTMNEVMKELGMKEFPSGIGNSRFFVVKKPFKEKYPQRYEILANAIRKAVSDPALQESANKAGLPLMYVDPETAAKMVRDGHRILEPFVNILK